MITIWGFHKIFATIHILHIHCACTNALELVENNPQRMYAPSNVVLSSVWHSNLITVLDFSKTSLATVLVPSNSYLELFSLAFNL